ncbi:MAG: SRPBCC domain-containing protein [Planctomycetota bacterium]
MSTYEEISVLPFGREFVWHALTQGELLRSWLPASEPRFEPDATFPLSGFGFGAGSARVLEVRAPKDLRLALVWGPLDTVLTLRLSEIVRGTRVAFDHSGFHGPRAWMLAKRQAARVRKLLEKELRPVLDRMIEDAELGERLERSRIARENLERERRRSARRDRDELEAIRQREADERREMVRVKSEARRSHEREVIERVLADQTPTSSQSSEQRPERATEARQRAEADALAEQREREEAERQAKLRRERVDAAAEAAAESENARRREVEEAALRRMESDLRAERQQHKERQRAERAAAEREAAEQAQPARPAKRTNKRKRRRTREEPAAERVEASSEPELETAAPPRANEDEAELRQRVFGELTSLLEAARGEALAAFRTRFEEAGIGFDQLARARAAQPVQLGRDEAVREFELRQEHERTRAHDLQTEREAAQRRSTGAERTARPSEHDTALEARLQEERRVLEDLLRERQAEERARFERALDERLTELGRAEERARELAEVERRRVAEERRAIEAERRSVEDERRRLAEDQARRVAEDVARESARKEIERARHELRREPEVQPSSPRERAAVERVRAARAQRTLDRRRRQEAERQTPADPKEAEREKRLRDAIARAERETSRDVPRQVPDVTEQAFTAEPEETHDPTETRGLGRKLSGLFGRRRGELEGSELNRPTPDRDGRILTLHPGDEPGSTIDADKYTAMRAAILAALPYDAQGVELKDLPDLVRPELSHEDFPRHVSITWYCVRVKLDLEARRLLEVVPGSRPQRVRRIGIDQVRKEA